MRSPHFLLLCSVLFFHSLLLGNDRYVTLTAPPRGSNHLDIVKGETVDVASFSTVVVGDGNIKVVISTAGQSWALNVSGGEQQAPSPAQPILFTGPGRVDLYGGANFGDGAQRKSYPAICTLRIRTEQFSPIGTPVIPPGSGGGVVSLLSSSDLVTWTQSTNGLYSGLPSARFFRIGLVRVQ